MSSKLDAALELAARGFPVFPLIPNGKIPLFAGWQAKATSDPVQLEAWWREEPQANIGIYTERLLVVDIDPRNGGADTMRALQMVEDFPDTLASVTAGGGAHLVFALPEGENVSGGRNILGPGIDIKSHGGLIVAPGSTIDGRPYAWVPGHKPTERQMAEAPQWIRDKCSRPAAKSEVAGQRIVEEDDTARAQAEHWLAKHAPEAVEGERDNTAFGVAAKLYDYGVTLATCRELLLEWNEGWCQPPLDGDAIERIIDSARKNRQTAIGSRHELAPGFEPHEIQTPTTIPATRPRIYSLSYEDAAQQALTNTAEPLIDGLLDRQAMSVWYGESNSGKTFVMLDAAWHVAAGRDWAGMPTKKGVVVYVAAEGGKGILKRVRALRERYADATDVQLHIVPCPVDLLRKDADLKPLIDHIRAIEAAAGQKAELVVIDTLSRAIAGGNENDSQDMGVFVAHLDAIRTHTGAHVAIVHHTGKDKAKGARGHSLLRAATDTEVEIDERMLTVTKQRDMDGELCMPFALVPARLGVSSQGKDVTSCTVDMNAAAGDREPMPLTPQLREFMDGIEEAMEEKHDNGDNIESFDWEFAGAVLQKIYLGQTSGKQVKRSTVQRLLTNLTENAHLKKVGKNQWVIVDAHFAQNAQS